MTNKQKNKRKETNETHKGSSIRKEGAVSSPERTESEERLARRTSTRKLIRTEKQ